MNKEAREIYDTLELQTFIQRDERFSELLDFAMGVGLSSMIDMALKDTEDLERIYKLLGELMRKVDRDYLMDFLNQLTLKLERDDAVADEEGAYHFMSVTQMFMEKKGEMWGIE